MEKNFSEKESIELISQMIKQTKLNMTSVSGNIFLYYGYFTVIISIAVFAMLMLTHNAIWSALWFLMFMPSLILKIKRRKHKPHVITYIDKAIGNAWSVVGSMFALTVISIFIIGYFVGECNFTLMLPLSLLYAGIGTSITGVITNVRILIYTPMLAFFVAIYMLMVLVIGKEATAAWQLYFGFSFLVMMVIPGHMLNKKGKKHA